MNINYFNYFLMCWMWGTISEAQLTTAVKRGYITEEQKQAIIASTM